MDKEIVFTCTDCQKHYRVIPGNHPWHSGFRRINMNRNLCRSCYDEYYRALMIKAGSIVLRVDLKNNIVHDIPNSDLHYAIASSKDTTKSAWGNTSAATLVRFIGPDGAVWSGSVGEWSTYTRFRRITIKPENITK